MRAQAKANIAMSTPLSSLSAETNLKQRFKQEKEDVGPHPCKRCFWSVLGYETMPTWQTFERQPYLAMKAVRITARIGIGRFVGPNIFKDTNFSKAERSAIKSAMLSPKAVLATIDELPSLVKPKRNKSPFAGLWQQRLIVIESGKRKLDDFFPFINTEADAQNMKQAWSAYQKNLATVSSVNLYHCQRQRTQNSLWATWHHHRGYSTHPRWIREP